MFSFSSGRRHDDLYAMTPETNLPTSTYQHEASSSRSNRHEPDAVATIPSYVVCGPTAIGATDRRDDQSVGGRPRRRAALIGAIAGFLVVAALAAWALQRPDIVDPSAEMIALVPTEGTFEMTVSELVDRIGRARPEPSTDDKATIASYERYLDIVIVPTRSTLTRLVIPVEAGDAVARLVAGLDRYAITFGAMKSCISNGGDCVPQRSDLADTVIDIDINAQALLDRPH